MFCVWVLPLSERVAFFPTGTPFVWLDISEPPLIRESDDTYLRRQEIRGPFGSRLWFTFPPVQKVW
jgi:hypothetical protein